MVDSLLDDLTPGESKLEGHGSARLVDATRREDVDYSYRFEIPLGITRTFDERELAERYRDVYLAVDQLTELDDSTRGVPAEIALSDRHVTVTYLYAIGRYDKEQLAERLDVDRATIRQYLYRTHQQAKSAENW